MGTLYNYFPDKASLVSAIVLRFWGLVSKSCEGNFVSGESALDCCRALFTKLKALLSGFQINWLREISMLDVQTLELIREEKVVRLDDIYEVIERALLNDPRIDSGVFEHLDSRRMARVIWRSLFDSLRSDVEVFDDFLEVLSLALYGPSDL